jgi:hypothetical protein
MDVGISDVNLLIFPKFLIIIETIGTIKIHSTIEKLLITNDIKLSIYNLMGEIVAI